MGVSQNGAPTPNVIAILIGHMTNHRSRDAIFFRQTYMEHRIISGSHIRVEQNAQTLCSITQSDQSVCQRQPDIFTINAHVLELLGVYSGSYYISQHCFYHEFQQIGRQKREETDSSDSDEASPVATWMHSLVCVCCSGVG